MHILQYSVIFTATLNFNLAAVVIIFIPSNSPSLPVNLFTVICTVLTT